MDNTHIVRRPRGNSGNPTTVALAIPVPAAPFDAISDAALHENSAHRVKPSRTYCGSGGQNVLATFVFGAIIVICAMVWWQYNWITLEIPTRVTPLSSAVHYYTTNPLRSDIIVSMTTIPGRERLVTLTIKCLLLQTKSPMAIHIHTPRTSRFPIRIDSELFENIPGVKIFSHDKDLGPSLKAIPEILAQPADQRIVYLDDDTLYPRTLIADLDKWSTALPDACVTGRGWHVPPSMKWIEAPPIWGSTLTEPLEVDIATGCGAVLVRPRFFDQDKLLAYDKAPPEAFFVDDIWLSGNLAENNVKRFIVPTLMDSVTQILQMTTVSLSGGVNKDGHNNDVILQYFAQYWNLNLPSASSTPVAPR
jgi:hypothetical protein